ncbi:MAG: YbaK/EbsC family protein [Nanoarchaeota archaeon]|nr:YbaK/EbsC family protein [Nanoarchaeota archaeon]
MKSLDYLDEKEILYNKIDLDEIPRSAKDVERLFGCPLHQVLKTVVLIGDKPVIAVIQGDKRISFQKIKEHYNFNSIKMANPNEVKELTGYPIGGVTPFGIDNSDYIFILDEHVLNEDKINIGSGKAEIGIELRSADLKKIWQGEIIDIIE